MRKKNRWMMIGTLFMAAICLICALLETASAVSYISMIGPQTGAGPADAALYVIEEAFAPAGAFFILLASAFLQDSLLHLGRKPGAAPAAKEAALPAHTQPKEKTAEPPIRPSAAKFRITAKGDSRRKEPGEERKR